MVNLVGKKVSHIDSVIKSFRNLNKKHWKDMRNLLDWINAYYVYSQNTTYDYVITPLIDVNANLTCFNNGSIFGKRFCQENLDNATGNATECKRGGNIDYQFTVLNETTEGNSTIFLDAIVSVCCEGQQVELFVYSTSITLRNRICPGVELTIKKGVLKFLRLWLLAQFSLTFGLI